MVPQDAARRQMWLESLGLDEGAVSKHSVVCSLHFKKEDIDRTSLASTRLKPQAIPYVQLPEEILESDSSDEDHSPSSLSLALKEIMLSDLQRDVGKHSMDDICCDEPLKRMVTTTSSGNTCLSVALREVMRPNIIRQEPGKRTRDDLTFDEPLKRIVRTSDSGSERLRALLQSKDESVQVRMSYVDKSTYISPKATFSPSLETEIRKQIAHVKNKYKKEINVLREREKRHVKKINMLKEMLRQKIQQQDSERTEILRSGTNGNNRLLRNLEKRGAGLPVNHEYSEEIRMFALKLHFYSPRAYLYVKDKLNLCLPHPKALFKWYKSTDQEPTANTVTSNI